MACTRYTHLHTRVSAAHTHAYSEKIKMLDDTVTSSRKYQYKIEVMQRSQVGITEIKNTAIEIMKLSRKLGLRQKE